MTTQSDVGCAAPHPADPNLLCELPEGHDGSHAILTWESGREDAAEEREAALLVQRDELQAEVRRLRATGDDRA